MFKVLTVLLNQFILKRIAIRHYLMFCLGAVLACQVSARHLHTAGFAHAEKIQVTFINPAYQGEAFWDRVTELMSLAAHDLNIEFEVLYSGGNRLKVLDLTKQMVKRTTKPDYLIFVFQAHLGEHLLKLTEAAKLHSFAINTNIPATEQSEIGLPRGKFSYWLGHMFPDEQHAGFLLASSLYQQAHLQRSLMPDDPISMIALAGSDDSAASRERLEGLQLFLKDHPEVRLKQVVNAGWQQDKAREITRVLLARYPETKIIWTASDLMALGALRAAEEKGLVPGKTVFTGGIDGTAQGLAALAEGRIQASLSGHFMEGAWSMVLLHDHYYGLDFADHVGTRVRSRLDLIQTANVEPYLAHLDKRFFENIDFHHYSLKEARQYHFSQSLIESVQKEW